MSDEKLLRLISLLRSGKGSDQEASQWIESLKVELRCPRISDLIFHDNENESPEDILRKAREYRLIQL